MPVLIGHPKRRGEWVELQFMARASAHGLTVSKPWGDSARYDFVVEHEGRFSRVQVKSTSYYFRGAYLCNTVSRPPGGKPVAYTSRQIDFLAAYVVPEEIWYVIPVSLLARARYAVALNPYRRDSKYFRYLEAWHLLRARAVDRGGAGLQPCSKSQ